MLKPMYRKIFETLEISDDILEDAWSVLKAERKERKARAGLLFASQICILQELANRVSADLYGPTGIGCIDLEGCKELRELMKEIREITGANIDMYSEWQSELQETLLEAKDKSNKAFTFSVPNSEVRQSS